MTDQEYRLPHPAEIAAACRERDAGRRRWPDARCSDGMGAILAAARPRQEVGGHACEWLTGVLQAGVLSRLEFCTRCGVVRIPPALLAEAIRLSTEANGEA